MQPIFTIHAGEYLVGSYIEQSLTDPNGNKLNVWIPSKDTGVDFLITDRSNTKTISLQVKFSKDFLITHGRPEYQERLVSCGWWTLNREKIVNSEADYWVFVLHTFNAKNMQYVILTPKQLIQRLDSIHPATKSLQTYLWVSDDSRCWETRGLKKKETDELILRNGNVPKDRDFTEFLNNWDAIFTKWA